LDEQGLIPGWGMRFFSSPWILDRFWGPPSFLSNRYQRTLSPGVKWQGAKLITHLHTVPRLRTVELYLHSPIHLPGILLNYIIKYTDNFAFFFYLM
jgi:hypothetical protein